MKLLLTYLSDSNDTREHSTTIAPVGLFTLAAYLQQQGHLVTVANFSHIGYKKSLKAVIEEAPEAVCISINTHNRIDSLKFTREIRNALPHVFLIAGGPHASAMAEEIAVRHPEFDLIIKGEGEISTAEFLKNPRHGKTRIIEGVPPTQLSDMPCAASFSGSMRWINVNEQFKYIHIGRGCRRRCPLCCSVSRCIERYRSTDDIINEIETAMQRYGIIYFTFRDDMLTANREFLLELCRKIREKNLYIMWNCQSSPNNIDFDMAKEMKSAGCERIFLTAENGSDKILALYNPDTQAEMIIHASAIIRKAGLYLSFYLSTGFPEEKQTDIRKTIKLIQKCLPGEGIVTPAVYYPGSPVCSKAIEDGKISPALFFNMHGKGIYLSSVDNARCWTQEIRDALILIRSKAWYTAKDFAAHRRDAGSSWVCDLLEGDMHLDNEENRRAEVCYARVIASAPSNPWGYFRMGKLRFRIGDFAAAEGFYGKVTSLNPAYYGGWLKLSESQIAQGKKKDARVSLDNAWDRNHWDARVRNLKKVL